MGIVQKIRVGNLVIESRELPWETIKALANEIKKVARWNPQTKEWILTWRVISNVQGFVRFINEKLMHIDQEYAYRILDIVETIMNVVPRIRIDEENNRVYVCIVGEDPYDIVRKVDREILPIRVEISEIEIPDIGKFEVPYLIMSIRGIISTVDSGKVDVFPDSLRDIIIELYSKLVKKKATIRVTRHNRTHVWLPRNTPTSIIEELKELGRIKYYYETPEGVLSEKTIEAYKIYERVDGISIYLPAFAAVFAKRILERHGIEVEIDYGLPDRKLDKLKEKYELYPHQLTALMRWVENGFCGTIVIPTGGGKTIIGIAGMVKLKLPTIIFVPNLWLLEQWREKIAMFTGYPKSAIGTLGGGEVDIRDITVATYQSGIKHIEKICRRFWLVIYDECHHIPARTFRRIAMNMFAPYRIALSATPKRRDKNETLLFKLAGGIVYSISYPELVKAGLLAPMIYRRIYVPLPPDRMLVYYQIMGEADRERNEIKKRQLINKLIAIAQENPNKLEVVKKIVEKHKSEKMFIFTSSIRFAKRIAKVVNDVVPAVALTAESTRSEEERIVKRFRAGLIRALVIIRKAEEGVDIGEASVAIITGGSKQRREFIQRIGRVLRPQKNKVAWIYEIISEGTIEEQMAKKRGATTMVKGIAKYVKEKYGLEVFKEIRWDIHQLE